ncbi:hypothetical protein MCAP1_001055 [Malassezia caprae]|uniref:Conserved oligomeric Golgi complex subunit 5 helical domain-containing protein n=1 Tax=Malassezia caprae TaxID=1381934 RepID=A0AAF0E7C4_9BASI|nr:hypothetical protein MCAP1_001055 [Malassezia caprae]
MQESLLEQVENVLMCGLQQHALSPPLLRWIDIIWERIQTFIVVELGSIVNKVQMLERILQRKYAPQSTQTLLDIVVSNLGDSPTTLLWSAFARSLEQLVHECIQESDFWWYIFVFSYPKLADQFNMLASHLIILSDDFETSKLTGHMEKMLTSRESDYQTKAQNDKQKLGYANAGSGTGSIYPM